MQYYITTPIFYVNGNPHLGHLYSSVIGDVLARYFKLFNNDVFFSTGTDEHGFKVERAAQSSKLSIDAFVDLKAQGFKNMMKDFNIDYDEFIRTTEDRHKRAAQYVWRVLEDKGMIYKGKYSGWYSVQEEAYYDESAIEDGYVKGTKVKVEWLEEECYYYKLSEMKDKLKKFFDENEEFIVPKIRANEIKQFLTQDLKDLCISRSNFSWGIKLPKDENHVMYVWIDALVNYISVLDYGSEKYKKFWPPYVHIIGKDISRFHAIYWIAMLMSLDMELPKHLLVHGWWLSNGEKMSKSVGNVVNLEDLKSKYTIDEVRYFLMREISFSGDGNFSYDQINLRINSELNNKLGNLIQRINVFVHKHYDGEVVVIDEHDSEILNYTRFQGMKIKAYVENFQLFENLLLILSLIDKCNEYINEKEPWKLIQEDRDAAARVIAELINSLRYIIIFLEPYMPDFANLMISKWNLSLDYQVAGKIEKIDILFSKKA